MRIIQLLPTMSFGDAVSNDAAAIHRMIGEMGREPEIYASRIEPRLRGGYVRFAELMVPPSEEDVLIYHASTGDPLNNLIPRLPGKKMIRYHNITPPQYFRGYSAEAEARCAQGYREISRIARYFSRGIADSDYNRQDMRRMGFRCPVVVCPIVIPWEDYRQEPDPEILETYRGDGWTNLLFVGRIAPNKRQENLIRAFYEYHWRYNPTSRLIILGNPVGMETYLGRLKEYTARLRLEGRVVFTGRTSFRQLLAYYTLSDVFVCMSEHEGFCVPIAEAMYFGLPIVALRAAAVPETMGRGGLLLDSPDPAAAAAAIDRLVRDEALRQAVRKEQEKRLEQFSYEAVSRRMRQLIGKMTGEE